MENLDFEFIDRAISLIKEKDNEAAAKLIHSEQAGINLAESRVLISLLHQIMYG
jgi:hypothetical protein